MNANKPCVTAREGIYFFREAGAVVGHLTDKRYVSSVEHLPSAELLCRSLVRYLSSGPQMFCAAPLNFIYVFLIVVYEKTCCYTSQKQRW